MKYLVLISFSAVALLGCTNKANITDINDSKSVDRSIATVPVDKEVAALDEVVFSDENLEKVIREKINKPEGPILRSEVEKIESLNAKDSEINEIEGIEVLTGLRSLNISYNHIADLNALFGLNNLKRLNVEGNQIEDISILSDLVSLKRLNLSYNSIEDISALSRLSLKKLNISYTRVYDLSVIYSQVSLRRLNIKGLPFTVDINGLSSLEKLSVLILDENKVINAQRLSTFKKLRELHCNKMKEFDFSSLEGLRLEKLELAKNDLLHIGFLFGMSSLKELSLRKNRLDKESLAVVSTLFGLERLNLTHNYISGNIDLSGLVSLNILRLRGNALRNNFLLSLAKEASLQFLDLSKNKISQISFRGGNIETSLNNLNVTSNKIKDISRIIEENGAISKLFARNNPVSSIPDLKGRIFETFELDGYSSRIRGVLPQK